jgi:hypothetical protein
MIVQFFQNQKIKSPKAKLIQSQERSSLVKD